MLARKIIKSFMLNGIGLHSGKNCSLLIEPCNSEFIIMSANNKYSLINNLKTSGTARGSDYIFDDNTRIRTCEHVLSGLTGLGIWSDVKITVEGGEMPALDGCSNKICSEILANSEEISFSKKFLCVKSPVIIHDENNHNRFIAFFPNQNSQDNQNNQEQLSITYAVNYEVVGSELFDFDYSTENYFKQISNARTFALYSDVEYLKSHGMALGGSLENAILIDNINNKIIASNGLRWHNEFVRHKVLDLIGDLASLGRPLNGHVIAVRAGHELHLKLADTIKNII